MRLPARPTPFVEAVAIVITACFVAALWGRLIGYPWQNNIDLYPTYVATNLMLSGNSDSIYHPTLFIEEWTNDLAWNDELNRLGIDNGRTSFTYHPLYLLLVLPLVVSLSYPQFVELTFLLSALAAVIVGNESLRLSGVEDVRLRLAGAVFVSVSTPMLIGIDVGQNIIITAALFLLVIRALENTETRWLALGLWLLACICKPWGIATLLVPLLHRRWRDAGIALLGYCTLFLIVARLVLPWKLLDAYASFSTSAVGMTVIMPYNGSIRSLLMKLAWPDWIYQEAGYDYFPTPVGILISEAIILTAILLFVAWVVRRIRHDPRVLTTCGLALTVCLLGITWQHYFVMSIPLAAYCVLAAQSTTTRAIGIFYAIWLFAIPYHGLLSSDTTPQLLHINWIITDRLLPYWQAMPTIACLSLIAIALLNEPGVTEDQRRVSVAA